MTDHVSSKLDTKIVRIGKEISYMSFNQSRNEDNSTRFSLGFVLLNFIQTHMIYNYDKTWFAYLAICLNEKLT